MFIGGRSYSNRRWKYSSFTAVVIILLASLEAHGPVVAASEENEVWDFSTGRVLGNVYYNTNAPAAPSSEGIVSRPSAPDSSDSLPSVPESSDSSPSQPDPSSSTPPSEPDLSSSTPPSEPDLSSSTPPSEPDLSSSPPPSLPPPLDPNCTADISSGLKNDCSVQQGQEIVDYISDIRISQGLPPFKTTPALLSVVRLELDAILNCDVCNRRYDDCFNTRCSKFKGERMRSVCVDSCLSSFNLCTDTECSLLAYQDCCSCSNNNASSTGKGLLERRNLRTSGGADCIDVRNFRGNPTSKGTNDAFVRGFFGIHGNRQDAADCAACVSSAGRRRGPRFVTQCKVCRFCRS